MDRIDVLQQFLREDPDDAFTRFALADELRRRGDAEAALEVLEALAAEQPDYVGTYYHLGKLYEELGRTDDALSTYRKGIDRAGAAGALRDRAELQSALLEAQGIGFED